MRNLLTWWHFWLLLQQHLMALFSRMSNIAVIVTSHYVPIVSASTEHLKPLFRITSLTLSYQLINRLSWISSVLITKIWFLLVVSIKYSTSDAKSSNMVALLTPFAATSNGFIFPHVRCSSAMHDLQHISIPRKPGKQLCNEYCWIYSVLL
jgi:hypothetical protein